MGFSSAFGDRAEQDRRVHVRGGGWEQVVPRFMRTLFAARPIACRLRHARVQRPGAGTCNPGITGRG